MTTKLTLTLSCFLALSGLACSTASDGESDTELTGQAKATLADVPAGVACVRITAAGSKTINNDFEVTPGASKVLNIKNLPLGVVTFSGAAFGSACKAVTVSAAPSFQTDPVKATLTANAVAS